MNILKIFRKPYLALLLAGLVLFFSCEQYELNKPRSFNYALYKAFKERNIELINIDFKNSDNDKSLQFGQGLLATLNNEYGSNLAIPDHILTALFTKTDIKDIKSFVVNEGLLSNQDVEDLRSFADKTETDNFQIAIDEFEQDIISRNLSDVEFEKFNKIASSLKITNEENSEIFDNNQFQARGPWSCLLAYLIWVAALIGFVAGCATVFLCAIALIGLASASYNVITECAGYM